MAKTSLNLRCFRSSKELLDKEQEKHKKHHDPLRKNYYSQLLKIEDEFDKNRREYQSILEKASTEMENSKENSNGITQLERETSTCRFQIKRQIC